MSVYEMMVARLEENNSPKYAKDCLENARRNLSRENVRYANGKMSHDVEREVELACVEYLADAMLDGEWGMNRETGKMYFANYADGTPA